MLNLIVLCVDVYSLLLSVAVRRHCTAVLNAVIKISDRNANEVKSFVYEIQVRRCLAAAILSAVHSGVFKNVKGERV